MNKMNVDLLNDVIQKKLNNVLEGTDKNSEEFNEAMKAIDRMIEIEKNNISYDKNEIDRDKVAVEKEKVDVELKKDETANRKIDSDANIETEKVKIELKKDETANRKIDTDVDIEEKRIKRELVIKTIEVGAAVVIAPLIEKGVKTAFAKMLCEFEKDYTFTTTAGRSLSSLFKFK